MFHQQLIRLREIFQKDSYPEDFIGRCFKLFLNRIHILKEKVPIVEKKVLRLVYTYLRIYLCKLGLNCKRSSKGYLTAVNYRLFLKFKINPAIIFALLTLFPKFLYQVCL